MKGEAGKVGSEATYGALICKFVVNGGNASDFRSIQERFAE
ncbi:hypothetical protein [Paraburkholderia adhaesiva]|nr:hypothetical protein [Paraburkholderia adhaesiva]